MTIEEARKVLDGKLLAIVLEYIVSSEAQRNRLSEKLAALNMAIEAIDMQIPKKLDGRECFCCGGDVGAYQVPYCMYCGQAIDWSDNDE